MRKVAIGISLVILIGCGLAVAKLNTPKPEPTIKVRMVNLASMNVRFSPAWGRMEGGTLSFPPGSKSGLPTVTVTDADFFQSDHAEQHPGKKRIRVAQLTSPEKWVSVDIPDGVRELAVTATDKGVTVKPLAGTWPWQVSKH